MRTPTLLLLAACEGKTLGFGSPLPELVPAFAVTCASDIDCVLVPAERPCACGCTLRAISATAEQDFYAWYLEENVACPPLVCPDCTPPVTEAVCLDRACLAREVTDEGLPGAG